MICCESSLYGSYRTRTFTDIFPTVDQFISDYKNIKIPQVVNENNATTLYYLLYGRHGGDHILNSDENQFKYRLFGTIFSYGLEWQKKLELQEKLSNLTEADLLEDSKVINNHAYNPSTEPSTATTEEFETTNEQVVRKGKKTKMDAYNELFDMIHSDFTAEFLKKFDRLFVLFAEPNQNKWYVTDTEGGE